MYAHDTEEKIAAFDCLPESLAGTRYYEPTEAGAEGRFKQKYEAVTAWRQEHKK